MAVQGVAGGTVGGERFRGKGGGGGGELLERRMRNERKTLGKLAGLTRNERVERSRKRDRDRERGKERERERERRGTRERVGSLSFLNLNTRA